MLRPFSDSLCNMKYIVPFLIGLAAGGFGGLVGVGGGIIMIPLMVGVLKFDQRLAHGTSLIALVFTGFSGALAYGLKGSVDVKAAVLLAATAMVTARLGARFAHALPEWKLKRAFGYLQFFVALMLILKPYLSQGGENSSEIFEIVVLLFTGVFTGFLSGMMGVGGGTIMVPSMVVIVGMGQHLAQGSSLLAMVPTGLVGAYTYWKLGNVKKDILPALIAGIFVGSFSSGTAAQYISEVALRVVFFLVLLYTAQKYVRTKKPSNG